MKKFLNYLSRYYRCVYDFNLFKKYFQEPIALAMIFALPLLLVFFFQSYTGSMETPNVITSSFDYYYDIVSSTTYSEVYDYPEVPDPDVTMPHDEDEVINFQIMNGQIMLDQEKVLEKSIESNNKTYRLVVDTNNTYEIAHKTDNEYDVEDKRLVGFHTADMVVYINDQSIIMSIGEKVYSYSIKDLKTNYESTDAIYHSLNENFVDFSFIIAISAVSVLFIGFIYVIATYFLVSSNIKKSGYKISKNRIFKICFYTLVPGLYTHLLIALIMSNSQFAMSILTPIMSVLVMSYLSTKTLENVKDFIKKEDRKERKLAKKQNT